MFHRTATAACLALAGRALAQADHRAPQIYERLATDDIRRACDVLRPLYDQTNHVDGRVSIEVSPLLAFNTQETIAEARWLAWISKVGSAGWP